MKYKSVIHGLYQSFYSKAFYQKVAREWDTEAFIYALLVTIIGTAVITASMVIGFLKFKPHLVEAIDQIPAIQITNGRVTASGPQPLFLNMHVRGNVVRVGVIDTGDHFKSIEEAGVPILLNSHELVTLKKGEKRIKSLAEVKDLKIDSEWLRVKISWVIGIMFGVGVPVMLIVLYGYQLAKGLLYTLAAWLWNGFFGSQLRFPALWRLSIVALTPASFLATIGYFVPRLAKIPHISLGYLFITVSYIVFAVWANIPEEEI